MNPEDVRREGKLIPNSRVILCKNGSHMCLWDNQVAGVTIPRGGLVYAVLASAMAVLIPDGSARSFSIWPGLLRRAPGLRLRVAPQALRWRRGLVLRGLEALPVVL